MSVLLLFWGLLLSFAWLLLCCLFRLLSFSCRSITKPDLFLIRRMRSTLFDPSMPPGNIEEQLISSGSRNTRIIKTRDCMFVEEGYYPTRKDAQERLKVISRKIEGDVEFFVEKRKAGIMRE